MLNALIKISRIWILCTLIAAPVLHAQILHELNNIECKSDSNRVSLSLGFMPDAPENFLVYTIVQQGSPVLVAEFNNALWLGKLYTEIVRPVTHIQMMRDTLGGNSIVRLFFYLEQNVPYQYRWEGNNFEVELLWSPEQISEQAPATLSGIKIEETPDSSVRLLFAFKPHPANYAINVLADHKNAIITFHNAHLDSGISFSEFPALLTDITIAEAALANNIPTAKIVLKTAMKIVCIDSTISTGIVLTLRPDAVVGAMVAEAKKTDSASTKPARRDHRMLKTKNHRKWTYIGIGSGVVIGGAILAAILSAQEDEEQAGTTEGGEIPPIEDVVPLPQE